MRSTLQTPIESHNEWDTLREVVIGSVQGAIYPDYGPIAAANGDPRWLIHYQGAFVEQDLIDLAEEQLDGFVAALQREGVVVHRPDPFPHNAPFETPLWRSRGGWNAANPRDLMLVVGDRVIECASPQRHRAFEILAYRRLLREWSARGARWESAPMPSRADALYDPSLQASALGGDERGDAPLSDGERFRSPITEFEPVWEAADVARCGDDLFVMQSSVTNRGGIDWLRRHLGETHRVHELRSRCPHPHHIDTTFVPLAPGRALVHPTWLRDVPDALEGWELIPAPAPTYPDDSPMATPYFTSQWLSMNVLSLDPRRVFVDAHQTALIALLSSRGFEPIPMPFDAVGAFGGSFHCASLDVRRG